MMDRSIDVVDAEISHAEALARIHVLAWRRAYRGLLPSVYLDALDLDSRVTWWTRLLDRPSENTFARVAIRRRQVVGFAYVGPVRAGPPDTGEIYAIYVDPPSWRSGAGAALMADAQVRLASSGFRQAVLWVLRDNRSARRFYHAVGWEPDGAWQLEEIGGVQVTELRYRRLLVGAVPGGE